MGAFPISLFGETAKPDLEHNPKETRLCQAVLSHDLTCITDRLAIADPDGEQYVTRKDRFDRNLIALARLLVEHLLAFHASRRATTSQALASRWITSSSIELEQLYAKKVIDGPQRA